MICDRCGCFGHLGRNCERDMCTPTAADASQTRVTTKHGDAVSDKGKTVVVADNATAAAEEPWIPVKGKNSKSKKTLHGNKVGNKGGNKGTASGNEISGKTVQIYVAKNKGISINENNGAPLSQPSQTELAPRPTQQPAALSPPQTPLKRRRGEAVVQVVTEVRRQPPTSTPKRTPARKHMPGRNPAPTTQQRRGQAVPRGLFKEGEKSDFVFQAEGSVAHAGPVVQQVNDARELEEGEVVAAGEPPDASVC